MALTSAQLKEHVIHGLHVEMEDAFACIRHCLDQLEESQVWERRGESLNSMGNLLLHVCGNLRQWIIAGVGKTDDLRKRQTEFDERGPIPKAELFGQLRKTLDDASQVMTNAPVERLGESLTIQGFPVSGAEALIHSVAHLRGHTQEIVYMTRLTLGDNYRFKFIPTTPEQGAS